MDSRARGKQPVRYGPPSEAPSAHAQAEKHLTHIDATDDIHQMLLEDEPESRSESLIVSPLSMEKDETVEESPPKQLQGIRTLSTPRLRKRVTAPSGTIHILVNRPEPVRRAISARAADPNSPTRFGKHEKASPNSISRTLSGPRPRITRRKRSIRKPGGRDGLKPRGTVLRVVTASNKRKYEALPHLSEESGRRSYPDRIREKVRTMKIEIFNTNIFDFRQRSLPGTPLSMVHTPLEPYGSKPTLDVALSTVDTPMELYSSGWLRDRRALHPIPPTKSRANSLPQGIGRHEEDTGEGTSTNLPPEDTELHSQSSPSIVEREGATWQQPIYWPGRIQLARQTGGLSGSARTLKSLAETDEEEEHRSADDAVVAGIVEYFNDFVIVDAATEGGLDHFWKPNVPEATTAGSPADSTIGRAEQASPIDPVPLTVPSLSWSMSGSLLLSSPVRREREQRSSSRRRRSHQRQMKWGQLLKSATNIL